MSRKPRPKSTPRRTTKASPSIAPELAKRIREAYAKRPSLSARKLAVACGCTMADVAAVFASARRKTDPKTVAEALAPPSARLSKPNLSGGDCTRCKHRPEPGARFEDTACWRCAYLGQRPGEDAEPQEEGHGRVVSLENLEALLPNPGDAHQEAGFAHVAAGGGADFYAQIDANLAAEEEARRTAETFGRCPTTAPTPEAQPILGAPPPPPHEKGEGAGKKSPPQKNMPLGVTRGAWEAVPEDAKDVFVSALAELGALNPTQIVVVMKRLAGMPLAEIGELLNVTGAAASAAVYGAARKLPFLRFLCAQRRTDETAGIGPVHERRRGKLEEIGRRYAAYPKFEAMADNGRLATWAAKTFSGGTRLRGEMEPFLTGLTGESAENPLSLAVWALMQERGLVAEARMGRRVVCGLPDQVRMMEAGYRPTRDEKAADQKQKARAKPRGAVSLYLPEKTRGGKKIPLLVRVGDAALKLDSAMPEAEWPLPGGAIQDAIGTCFSWPWAAVEGSKEMEMASCGGKKISAHMVRRRGRVAFILEWKDNGRSEEEGGFAEGGRVLWAGRTWRELVAKLHGKLKAAC